MKYYFVSYFFNTKDRKLGTGQCVITAKNFDIGAVIKQCLQKDSNNLLVTILNWKKIDKRTYLDAVKYFDEEL